MKQPFFKLNTGASIPSLGFGSGTPISVEEMKAAVVCAIKLGYRHFDTAGLYGTEAGIGEGLAQAFATGLVSREDIFLTTKLKHEDHGSQDVLPALQKSLSALKMNYVDLFLIHAPLRTTRGAPFPPKEEDFLPVDIPATWEAMEECFRKGLAKAIGVSNFSTKKLHDLLQHAKITPAVDQVEVHPLWQQEQLRDLCKRNCVQVIAWSPLGGLGKPWGSKSVIEHPVIQEIALKHHKSPAQVIIRWLTESNVAPVVKSYNSQRLLENINSFDFSLADEDHKRIESIAQERLGMWDALCNFTTSPYKSPFELWDGEI
ncbi:hypothetical protein SELMODRAFT_78332 [Selaginella moellendorffii]|uniref:NADP-dependent oxidoreductase domain-containing protein n=2 Tax=Selaginella moellendorffii TaxID=88036 RepID=D8QWB6_SELML|nr:hypothetical protein SELMODRAFT_78332 [Selaginella moellendorffii]